MNGTLESPLKDTGYGDSHYWASLVFSAIPQQAVCRHFLPRLKHTALGLFVPTLAVYPQRSRICALISPQKG